MIFFAINLAIGLFLIWFSLFVDVRANEVRMRSLVNMTLLSAITAILFAICILFSFWLNEQLSRIFGTAILFCGALLSVQFLSFCVHFPEKKKTFFGKLTDIVFLAAAFYVLIYQTKSISITKENGFDFVTANFQDTNFSWKNLYFTLYIFVLPALGLLSMLLRIDSIRSRIHRLQMFLSACAAGSAVLLYKIIDAASTTIDPMFNTLFPFVLTIFILVLYKAINLSVLFDIKTALSTGRKFLYSYLIQAAAAGVVFAVLLPLRTRSPLLWLILVTASVFGILFVSYYMLKIIKSRRRNFETDYSKSFEEDLASLDYTETTEHITNRLVEIFKENVDTTSVDIFIESNEHELTPVYSSQDKVKSISLNNPMFDQILNADHPVIFRPHIDTHHVLAGARKELQKIFDQMYAEAMIVLKEGRHIFGVIFLGQKRLGNIYTDYDLKVFLSLYSYFFVVGYYMKNIANESVVGTVNRELQFSGQIIQSIQENVDAIDNPKADVGYITKSARALGGEFVDFIRLTEERYIFTVGDMSGKGINASMSMVILKSIIRTFLAETKDFKQLVQKVNSFIRFNLPKGTFFAGVFALIDFSDNTLYYINCGIPALFMYNQAYNNVIEIQGDGRVLGFVSNVEKLVKVKKVKINAGDIILACTDGLIESTSLRGEPFGKARVQQLIQENLHYPAERMAQFLHTALLEFTSKELEDDVSVLAIKYLSK